MQQDAGIFYEIRYRLRGRLAHQRSKLGKPFTPIQEDAWMLLNEVEQMVKLIEQIVSYVPKGHNSELAYKVWHTLLMHQPAWKSELETSLETSLVPSSGNQDAQGTCHSAAMEDLGLHSPDSLPGEGLTVR